MLTPQEYLVRESRAETRSEFYRGEMFAMSGASWPHNRIHRNLLGKIDVQLGAGPFEVVGSDQRVKVDASGLYTYPDLLIVCGTPQFEDRIFNTLVNPHVIFEILSDSTEKYDRGAKFVQYREIPSLKEYVLVAQDRPLIERFVRQGDETWVLTAFTDLAQTFSLGTLPVSIPLAEIYRGVEFSDAAATIPGANP